MIKKECGYCGKVIEAYTDKQGNILLKQHILSKHPDKITVEVRDEGKQS